MEMEYLQNYWWLLISVLGAALVFMLFVQGGQTMLLGRMPDVHRNLIVSVMGRKWELTFTTLVVFGGAFFASFPLFYSTSFGGAYWLWMLILFSFILQAVSYEFRSRQGNLYGRGTYDIFLFINGTVGCVLLGVAVSMMFTGGEFRVTMTNILDAGSPVISTWAPSHGFEAIFCWKNWLLGLAVVFLARMQAGFYLQNQIAPDSDMQPFARRQVVVNGVIFVVFFLAFLGMLFMSPGVDASAGELRWVDNKYLFNFIQMWWVLIIFAVGVVMVLYAFVRTLLSDKFRCGIWYSGIGTALVVMALFWVAGYNDTAYYPSLIDTASSLTIRNSSSTEFTLTVMSCVSLVIPFVLAYIVYVWYSMSRRPVTPDELH
ncbi:MAG: cytochrome d ubiquinol oxidase subunit II [Muribaculum sp.]|nr:cytochrome d ubiquinol oxidase subunit II [Muribaculum sp.]